MNEGVDVRLQPSDYLLQPQCLKAMLDLGEAAFDAVELRAVRKVKDILYSQFVQLLYYRFASMDREIVPEQADLSALCEHSEMLDEVEKLCDVD